MDGYGRKKILCPTLVGKEKGADGNGGRKVLCPSLAGEEQGVDGNGGMRVICPTPPSLIAVHYLLLINLTLYGAAYS